MELPNKTDTRTTVTLIVKGKVHGVYYRQSTKKEALRLGIKGEVSNAADGTVYIIATGEENSIDDFISWCKKGPVMARVDEVVVNKVEIKEFNGFDVVR